MLITALSEVPSFPGPPTPHLPYMLLPENPQVFKDPLGAYKCPGRQAGTMQASANGILLGATRLCSPWALGGDSVAHQKKLWMQVLEGSHPSKGSWACRWCHLQFPLLVHSSGHYCPLLSLCRTGFKPLPNSFLPSVLHQGHLQNGFKSGSHRAICNRIHGL